MPLNSKLLKFRNLNIKTYLNNILPQFEKSILISDLNFIEKIRKEVDTEIFKSFLLNSDSLLEVLYTYESVKNNLNNLEDIKNDFKFKNEKTNNDDFNNLNLIKLEEFKTVLNNFTSEVQSYDTGSRILIHFDIFLDENDNKNIFLLTNDILIIGKIDSRIRKYQLVNAYSYLIVDIKIGDGVCEGEGEVEGSSGDMDRYREDHGQSDREYGDNTREVHGQNEDHYGQGEDGDNNQRDNTSLPSNNNSFFYLVLSKSFTKFKGNKKNIYKFYSIFKDLNYNFEDLNEKNKKNKKKNELIEFLIETEQYEEIEKFRKNDNYYYSIDYNSIDNISLTKSDLDKILNLFKNNPLNFLFDFLLKRFKSVLENVNKVMPFKDLIDLLFDEIFMKFRKEQKEILKNVNLNININYLLLLEKEILEIFKLIENRGLNNDLMKDKLLFDQYDFTYLTDYFTKKKKYYQEEKFKEAKKEIDVLLSEMVK